MPLLNSRANVLAGVAGQQSSIDGVLLAGADGKPIAGYAAFRDDDTIVGQSADGTALYAVPVSSPTQGVRIAAHGASLVVGGAGRWASVLDASPATLIDGNVPQIPPAGPDLYACGPDGTVAWKRDRQASSGLVLTAPDGSSVEDTAANLLDVQVLGPGQAIGVTASLQPYAIGVAVPKPALPSRVIRAVTLGSERWLICGLQAGGLVAQRDGASEGYVLVPIGGNAFRPDARVVNGSIVVCWSTTAGERPQDIQKVTLDVTNPRVALVSQPTTVTVQPGALQAVQAHPRKLWIAPYFSFSEKYGDAPDFASYGNAAALVSDATDPTALQKTIARVYQMRLPLIVDAWIDPAAVRPYLGSVVAWLASGAHLSDLGPAVEHALSLYELPVIAYCDAPEDWPSTAQSWMTGRVWPAVQAYRRAGESVSDFSARLTALLARVAAYGSFIVLTPRWDDVNNSQPVSFTTECMPIYADAIEQFPICGVMPFSDRRGHGISADPDLKAWAVAFNRANLGKPNRYEYWDSDAVDEDAQIRNILGQTVEVFSLTPRKRKYLLGRIA